MSIPEPDPVNEGVCVPDALIEFIQQDDNGLNQFPELAPYVGKLTTLIKDRDAFGRSKYNQPLMSRDGRSGVEDAKQELGDLLQYLFKCKLNGEEDLEELEMMILCGYTVIKRIFKYKKEQG